MKYFNYHSKIKSLILQGHLVDFVYYEKWNKIENCYVCFFDNNRPMPIRSYKIGEYIEFFRENNIDLHKTSDK